MAWLEASDVDVLAIQETKAADHTFPFLTFEAIGYEVAHVGVNQWNGVAIVSRVGLDDVTPGFAGQPGWGDPPQVEPRAVAATCAGVRVCSVYVPNGRGVDDPHYAYKVRWLQALRTAAASWSADPAVIMGDWNVAPSDADVWDPAFFDGKTHVTEPERAALAAFADIGFTELTAERTPGQYTYWDYQQLAFPKNRGMRIDLAFGNEAFARLLRHVTIDREQRKGKGASDHVPVVLDLEQEHDLRV